MRINNNMMAMNTHRQLGMANTGGAKSMEKLSSGLRINRAGDDAAGLAISEKMRGQIRGLNQASANAQDGISLIQTAEGALNETHAILQRMRELSVQSSTDTNTDTDRGNLQDEMDQLAKEISRIGETTEFNTQNLLGGKFDGTFHIGANEGQNLSLKIGDMRSNALAISGYAKIEQEGAVTAGAVPAIKATGEADGTYTIDATGKNLKDKNDIIVATSTDGLTWIGNDKGALGKDTILFEQEVDTGSITILGGKVKGTAEFDSSLESGDYTLDQAKGQILNSAGEVIAAGAAGDGTDTAFISTKDGSTTLFTLDAAAAADMKISVGGSDISSQKTANKTITTVNNALETVSKERSKLGALQNRLEHTIKNVDTSAENLQASEARIRDVDMAKEMMEQTKQNILQQASTAMLANANQAPQAVLQLLR